MKDGRKNIFAKNRNGKYAIFFFIVQLNILLDNQGA